tara:strand:- start:1226 stop:1501 length:276 start_codon:yes stop_codon:yes gene_type:complete
MPDVFILGKKQKVRSILTVVDGHGDTWLYPFASPLDAEATCKKLERLSSEHGDELIVNILPLESTYTEEAIVEEWEEYLNLSRFKPIKKGE